MSRRTGDPLLATGQGDAEARDERRGAQRHPVERPARLRTGELILEGTLRDAAPGGVFIATYLLIEVGERGDLLVEDLEVPVQVIWLRGNAHPSGPGMGLVFSDDARAAPLIALLGG